MNMYIHIPFCDQRCGYCSFFTRAGQNQATQIRVLEHIKRQWNTQTIVTDKRETIYMGGGTPSSLDLPVLRDFLTFVRENIYNHTTQEWTIEMHPEHVTPEKLELIQSLGCTRVSIGVQSFDPQTRAALWRTCSQEAIERAGHLLQTSGIQWSLDLIFGVEGQTLEAWAKDLTQVEKWNPHGLSLYDLEEYSQGIQRTDDTTRDTMIVMRDTWATEQGYRQYEVSNFARPWYECKHHLDFWYGKGYSGIGPGAVGCFWDSHGLNITEWIADFDVYCTAEVQETTDTLDAAESRENLWERFTRLQWDNIRIPEWIQNDMLLMHCLQQHGDVKDGVWSRNEDSRYLRLPLYSGVFDF